MYVYIYIHICIYACICTYMAEQVNRLLGPLLYVLWTLIGFFLLLNMFVAILNDAIDEVGHDLFMCGTH